MLLVLGSTYPPLYCDCLTDVRLVKIGRNGIISTLRAVSDPCYVFISSLLSRKVAIQANFTNNLMDPSAERLVRVLEAMARLNEVATPPCPEITQQDWANMIGITRQRVNRLLRKFRKRGFIDDSIGLKVNRSIPAGSRGRIRPRVMIDDSGLRVPRVAPRPRPEEC